MTTRLVSFQHSCPVANSYSRPAHLAQKRRRRASGLDALPKTVPNGTATHSTQMCVRNRTAVTCAVLAQNVSDPASSEQRLRVFKALTPADGAQEVKERHQRARLCAACDRQDVDAVLTRLMGTTGRRQLSVGVPQCLSAARPSCGAAAPRRLQRLGHLPGLRSSARPRVRRRLRAPATACARRLPRGVAEPQPLRSGGARGGQGVPAQPRADGGVWAVQRVRRQGEVAQHEHACAGACSCRYPEDEQQLGARQLLPGERKDDAAVREDSRLAPRGAAHRLPRERPLPVQRLLLLADDLRPGRSAVRVRQLEITPVGGASLCVGAFGVDVGGERQRFLVLKGRTVRSATLRWRDDKTKPCASCMTVVISRDFFFFR
jgi:hypothetical protein